MYREIKVGEKIIPMKATAATPLRYRHVFHKDVIKAFQTVEDNYSIAIDTISELAFIMTFSAKGADMTKLNEDQYIEWLDQFETFDLTAASEEIIDLYLGNTEGLSELKKNLEGAVKEN